MKLRKVISGGQTGADKTALECAKALGLETGGTVPLGCRTDEGRDQTLVTEFGCVESEFPTYPPRTALNIKNSEATVWFGDVSSPGGRLTKSMCENRKKPFFDNPDSLVEIADLYEVVNFAGNRRRINQQVVQLVREAFSTLRRPQP